MTSISIKEYFAVRGSPYSDKDARIIGPVLQSLTEQGALTTRDIVDAARSEQSPLHEYFEWNDRVAADLYRVDRARNMLSSIKVRFTENDEVRETRAFHVARTAAYEDGPRKYRTFEVLHGDTAFAATMMDSAFQDLQTWKRKYEPYIGIWNNFGDAFQQVLNQISEWTDEYAVHNSAVETDEALVKLLAWREECGNALQLWTTAREQMDFIMSAIATTEKAFSVLNERKERNCMKCSKPFMSVSAGNRICKTCLNAKTINEKNQGAINAEIVG